MKALVAALTVLPLTPLVPGTANPMEMLWGAYRRTSEEQGEEESADPVDQTGASGDGTAAGSVVRAAAATLAVTSPPGALVDSAAATADAWGEAFFAPYVDMAGWPVPNLLEISQTRGITLLTLAFLQATPDGKLAWAGLPVLSPTSDFEQAQAINASIATFRAAGGDVMISLGGASGTSLAQSYAARGLGAQALADAYRDIVDTYQLKRIDFDIEGAAVADQPAITLNSQALKLLQEERPDLDVWYTLPVLPTGLTADGLNVVRSALNAGVALDGVNVMAMDYGESAAPTSGPNARTMGAYAIQAAEQTHTQLTSLFSRYSQNFGWNQLGVTPMIGVNDVTSEVFTVADAQMLEDFARTRGLGMLSMWSVARDTPGSIGQATPTASGLNVPAGSFSNVFGDYPTAAPPTGSLPTISVSDMTVTEGNSGNTPARFTVTLSQPSTDTVSVSYTTANGTAAAGSDYIANAGTVTFAPGVTTQTVQVGIIGDTTAEGNETFTITLSSPSGATIAKPVATGTITNDDAQAPTPGGSASVDYVVVNDWGSGFIGGMTVKPGDAALDGWTVEFDTPAQISSVWNADIASHVGTHYVIRNASWNGQVAVGKTASFGFQATPGSAGSPVSGLKVNGVAVGTPSPTPTPTPPSISVADATVNEGNSGTSDLDFTVTLSKAATTPVTVAYATSNGTATAGSDYTSASGTVTFAAGETTKTITVKALGDQTVETNETVNLTLSNPSGATIADGTALGTIANDDTQAPAPSGAGTVDFRVTDDWGSGQTALVTLTAGASALSGWTVEFDTPAQISSIWNADIASHVGTHYVVKNAGWNGQVGAGQSTSFGYQASPGGATSTPTGFKVNGVAVGTPSPTPAPTPAPTPPSISVADATVNEGNSGTSDLDFTVTLSKAATTPVTVAYATSNGTATAGSDYTSASGTLNFAAGETTKTITVKALGDQTVETNETVNLTLSNPSGATIADATALGTITNDDVQSPAPGTGSGNVSFVKTSDWGSGFNGDVTVTNTATQPLSNWQVSFDFPGTIGSIWNGAIVSHQANTYVVKGADWNSSVAAGGTVSFGFTATPGTPTNFVLSGTAGPGIPGTPVTPANPATPANPDPQPTPSPATSARLSVADAVVMEGDSGTKDMVFNVNLSKPATEVVKVSYRTEDVTAVAGSDYQAAQGDLTFAVGETSRQVRVVILGDQQYEGSESLALVLSGISGAEFDDARGAGVIGNDDAIPGPADEQQYRVVGYFAEWGIYDRNYQVMDVPADKLTHLNYAFADISDSGQVVLFDSWAAVDRPYAGDMAYTPVKGNFHQLAKLKEQNPDLQTLISVGGWTLSDKFSDVALTDASRETFATSAVDFMVKYGFDGIDLDWEYPVSGGLPTNTYRPQDGANYVLLVKKIREKLNQLEQTDGVDGKKYLLTIAAPAGYDKVANFDLVGMEPYLDWFNVMTYDFHGAWDSQTGHLAPLYADPASPAGAADRYFADYAIDLYLAAIDPSKIVMGAPLYGRSWTGVPNTADGGLFDPATGAGIGTFEPGTVDYWNLLNLVAQHPDQYHVYWDDAAKASYVYSTANGGTFITYESPEALQYKIDYIKSNHLGGIMFWELDADFRNVDDPRSLLGLASGQLLGGPSTTV